MKYDFRKIEAKWRRIWGKNRIYEPNLSKAKRPFYNLMMFPYPSAEGLHVGNMYAFTGSDVYGRFKRMQGYDVFEPIGLDGFGIHSENYALKIGKHPMEQAKISERRFYKQLEMIGNGFAWDERLETYDPEYYKWTQWLFLQMWKHGLAYRRKQEVNWCPSCKTVLADEQVIAGECERCGSKVVRKELEQWFFKITDYAERLLNNLPRLDWSEKIKTAQRNWIGRSEGAELEFEIRTKSKPNFVLLHGYNSSPRGNFFPWLKKELEKMGMKVQAPALPHRDDPNIEEQIDFVLGKVKFNANTVLLGHSLGAVVAMKAIERLKKPIRRLVLAGGFTKPKFEDHPRSFEKTFNWKFNFAKIKRNVPDIRILHDLNDKIVSPARAEELHFALGESPVLFRAEAMHICGEREPVVLKNCIDSIVIFTTRPDTLFGATYVVLAPEHSLISRLKPQINNWKEVEAYIKKARSKAEAERVADVHEKTGIELIGVKAVNPATGKEIPIWIADYVLSGYGTGAIMAVPAHDERDWEFAKKYKLPAVRVVYPNHAARTHSAFGQVYSGEGYLVRSGRFTGMDSEKAKLAITKFVGGEIKTQYKLRDWLVSRQRYWGPPIPMIYCSACAKRGAGEQSGMPGWYAVPEKNLPVHLPFIRNFRPRGKGQSPLASHKEFYETRCPGCGGKARRETDVSDTFLDSAWYYLRYLDPKNKKEPFGRTLAGKWLPVSMYIGGAEHAVLHLLYVRFIAMTLHDWKYVHFDEPMKRFRAHGLLIKEGAKMSKSKGNVVNPDEYIGRFGADVLRMYLMFLAPFEQGGDFRDQGLPGITRFLERVLRFNESGPGCAQENYELERTFHKTIKKVGEDIESLKFNTAISALMVLLSEMEKTGAGNVTRKQWEIFLKLLAPFAPFIAEELYQSIKATSGRKQGTRFKSIHRGPWPEYNPKMLQADTIRIIVQVNGKVRDTLQVSADAGEEKVKQTALQSERVVKFLGNAKPTRVIYVPRRLINFVL